MQKESEPFDVPTKNLKLRTTAKVSVLHRTNHQANVNILKATLVQFHCIIKIMCQGLPLGCLHLLDSLYGAGQKLWL